MNTQNVDALRRRYLVGAVIVWVTIIAATGVLLAGTPYLGQMLLIVGGGAAYFIVLVPGWLFK